MKNLFKLARTVALVLICCLIVSVPVSASDDVPEGRSTVKVNVTLKGKTALVLNKGSDAFTLKSLKKKWGTPKVKKVNSRKVSTFKAGKSYVELIPWSVGSDDGYSLTICAKDKNLKVNGVYVGMTKKAALKALRKSFGKAYVKLGKGMFADATEGKTCIQVWYGGFMPMEFVYNAKGKITMIYFWHS